MFKSILLPVGSSDIDGPDVVAIPWGEEEEALFRKRIATSKRIGNADPLNTCIRYLATDSVGFIVPPQENDWAHKLETIHVENTLLGTRHNVRYFLNRWKEHRVPMPDPARYSIYPDGSIFLSGPIGLSALRWETSCGIRLGKDGKLEAVHKDPRKR